MRTYLHVGYYVSRALERCQPKTLYHHQLSRRKFCHLMQQFQKLESMMHLDEIVELQFVGPTCKQRDERKSCLPMVEDKFGKCQY